MTLGGHVRRWIWSIGSLALAANDSPLRAFFLVATTLLTTVRVMDGSVPSWLIVSAILTTIHGLLLAWRDQDLQQVRPPREWVERHNVSPSIDQRSSLIVAGSLSPLLQVLTHARQCVHHRASTTDEEPSEIFFTGHAFTPVACWVCATIACVNIGALVDTIRKTQSSEATAIVALALVLAVLEAIMELGRCVTIIFSRELSYLMAMTGGGGGNAFRRLPPPSGEWGLTQGHARFQLISDPMAATTNPFDSDWEPGA